MSHGGPSGPVGGRRRRWLGAVEEPARPKGTGQDGGPWPMRRRVVREGERPYQFAAGRLVAGRAVDLLRKMDVASWRRPAAGDPKQSAGQDGRGV